MSIYRSVTDLIGNTPLLILQKYGKQFCPHATILAKLEYFNPAGSAKDRVAAEMIAQAEADGKLQPGATIIEPTSGNTGIGLAAIAAAKGYRIIITMPETMSEERRRLMRAYGAELGIAFQITYDILDVIGDEATVGKEVRHDAESEKATWPSLLGLEASIERARRHCAAAEAALEDLFSGADADFLRETARKLVNRTH